MTYIVLNIKISSQTYQLCNYITLATGCSPHESCPSNLKTRTHKCYSGFSPGHLGVRAPYALHYEPYALMLALRFIHVALRVVRVWYVPRNPHVRVLYTVLRVNCSSSVALSGLVIGRLHYCVGLVGDFPTGNS